MISRPGSGMGSRRGAGQLRQAWQTTSAAWTPHPWVRRGRPFKPRMQYSAMTLSAPTQVTFDALYRPLVRA